MKSTWLPTVVMFVLGMWPSVGWSQKDYDDDEIVFHGRINKLLLDKQRDELETIIDGLRRDRPSFVAGRSQLVRFYDSLSDERLEANGRMSIQRAAERAAHIRAWHLAKPTVTTRIALANSLVVSAWAYRTEGSEVTIPFGQENEKLEPMDEAEALLIEAEKALVDASAKDAFLYSVWMSVGFLQGYTKDRMRELLDRSLEIDPRFFVPLDTYSQFVLSQQHGGDGDLLPVAEELAEQTREQTGEAAYAILAHNALMYHRIEGFSDDGFAWPRVRQGVRDWIKCAPGSRYRWGILAKFAHMAADRETAAEAVGQLKGRRHSLVFERHIDYLRTERWALASPPADAEGVVLELGIQPILDVAYVWEGQGVVPGVPTRKLEVRSTKDGTLQNEYQLESGSVELLAADATGQYVIFSSPRYRETRIGVLDLDSGKDLVLGTQPGRTRSLCVSRDSRFIIAGNDAGQIKRWENAEVPIPIDWDLGKWNKVVGLTLTPDQSLLISIAKRQARVWEFATRTGVRAWEVHSNAAYTVACSPDGKIMATAGFGNEVKLWRIEDGSEAGTLVGGNTSLHSLAFSPDGKRLVAGTMSDAQPQIPGEVIVWDVESKQAFPPLVGHRLGIWKIKISPDGSQIASASEDGSVRLWPMPK
jgi:hypothetical protein